MFCPTCGREIPDDAKFCTFCGSTTAEPAPRHAKPGPVEEELYSYSDENMPRDVDEYAFNEYQDQTRVYDPAQPPTDETKVYDFGMFEDQNGAYPDEPPYPQDRDIDPHDSYEMYQDGEDDDTFMDKLDHKFRRYDDEEDDEDKKKNLTWLWIAIIAFLLVLLIVFGILFFTGALTKKDKNAVPTAPASATVATVAPATLAPTQAQPTEPEEEEPTEAPETYAPETYAPETEAPAPVYTDPPAPTLAPEPTDAPYSEPDDDDNEDGEDDIYEIPER